MLDNETRSREYKTNHLFICSRECDRWRNHFRLVLVPGLTCTARLYGPQVAALWPFGPVTVADHRRDGEIGAVARRILASAPPRFALAGLSYGGYIAFEIVRQAADRIIKLALLDTSARADTPEQTVGRNTQIAMAEGGRYGEIADLSIPRYLNAKHQRDERLTALVRDMVAQTGPEAFVLQLKAIMSRPDSRPLLGSIRCPTLVLVGDGDARDAARTQQGNRRRHCRREAFRRAG